MSDQLVKRESCYIMKPTAYEISCDLCGGKNIMWSEFEHRIWCYDCEKDTPGNPGIFDGPIPVQAAKLLGMSFDKIEIETGTMLYLRVGKRKIYWNKIPPKGMKMIKPVEAKDGQK